MCSCLLGGFYGAGVQFAPYPWSRNNDHFGPSQGGVHIYDHHNLMIDAEGGCHFPFRDIEETPGPRAQVAMRFALW